MLKILACACGGVDQLARGLLQECEYADWLTAEIHKGKEHCLTVLSFLADELGESLPLRALQSYIENTGTFTIVVGYDPTHLYWEDFHTNAPIERARAKAIVEAFA